MITEAESLLIEEKEAMSTLGVKSRQTIWNYTNHHNFPKPIRTRPKAYLREAFNEWINKGGVNQAS